MIPKDMSVDSIIPNKEIFLTAWDLNNRTPRFFSKWSAKYWNTQTFHNDLTLGQMTLASMSTPEFVEPYTINSEVYISGDNVAKSPSLFAYLFTKKRVEERLFDSQSKAKLAENNQWCVYFSKNGVVTKNIYTSKAEA